jgi:prepilin-type processing-associated H-X9-DG protein
MLNIVASLMICALGQAPDQPSADARVRSIAPFVDSGVIAVLQLDMTRDDLPAIVARFSGGFIPSPTADGSKAPLAWYDGLRRAGARELFVVIHLSDMPGLPIVVVPLHPGADAGEIGRLFCGGGKEPPPIRFPTCATLYNAVMVGTASALDRVRSVAPPRRPELADAFAALNDGSIGHRLLVLPTADTRRVIEEMVPILPRELGGGPITDITRGLVWAAFGLDAGPKPSFRLVVATPGESAARSLQSFGQSLATAVGESVELQGFMTDFSKFTAKLKTEIVNDRIIVTADAQVAAGIIESALRPARQAALRTQCVNNQKQIALAIHNYISSHKRAFPPAYTADKAGKPLLSWRVLILPFLDQQQALFKEFHLDEPWDSAHNRALISKMPEVYRCPAQNADTEREGKTRYIAPRAPGTIFRGAEPVKINEITDGTSNTIMFFDGGDERAVTWTKPDDWEVPPDANPALPVIPDAHGDRPRKGTNVAFADGSVRFFRETIKPAVFRALLTYAGGEVISSDDY